MYHLHNKYDRTKRHGFEPPKPYWTLMQSKHGASADPKRTQAESISCTKQTTQAGSKRTLAKKHRANRGHAPDRVHRPTQNEFMPKRSHTPKVLRMIRNDFRQKQTPALRHYWFEQIQAPKEAHRRFRRTQAQPKVH